jgi:hypothetical protein
MQSSKLTIVLPSCANERQFRTAARAMKKILFHRIFPLSPGYRARSPNSSIAVAVAVALLSRFIAPKWVS